MAQGNLIIGNGGGTRLLASVRDYGLDRGRRFTVARQKWLWNGGAPPARVVPGPGGSTGEILVSASAQFSPGFAEYVWRYETLEEGGGGGGDGSPGGRDNYGTMLEGSVNKSPITSHLNFGKWIGYKNPQTGAKYGRVVNGEVIWELRDPTGQSKKTGLDKDGGEVKGINPFYGIQDFYDIGATSIQEMPMSRSALTGLFNKVGKIGSPPGDRSGLTGGNEKRNWLYVGASATQVGNKFRVRKTWLLSGPGGWEKALYE